VDRKDRVIADVIMCSPETQNVRGVPDAPPYLCVRRLNAFDLNDA
jgi:hypothetical protein